MAMRSVEVRHNVQTVLPNGYETKESGRNAVNSMGHRTRDVPSVSPAFPRIRESERTTLKPLARLSEHKELLKEIKETIVAKMQVNITTKHLSQYSLELHFHRQYGRL
jgi:hypothetical protein